MFRSALIVPLCALGSIGQEIFSDLTTSPTDERRALQIKRDEFWQPLLDAAEKLHIPENLRLCAHAETVIAGLPEENEYVRTALSEATTRLQRANERLLQQELSSVQLAHQKLDERAGADGGVGGFLNGGDLFSRAMRHFVGEGAYSERLSRDIANRQTDVLPVLQGTASISGNMLDDCRLASKRGFDVLKYDIYNKGVPKTPASAKELAHQLIDAAGRTRHQFMSFVTTMVSGITRDVEGKEDRAATTVVRNVLRDSRTPGAPDSASTEQLINL